MLVVKVELWPGERVSAFREIGRIAAANVSDLRAVLDYVAVLEDDGAHQSAVLLTGHHRESGFWPLLARLAASRREAAIRGDLEPRWQEVADLIGERIDEDRRATH